MAMRCAANGEGLRWLVEPVERTNGDILLATQHSDGTRWVMVGDFTGHGLPAAIASPLVAHIFYSAAQSEDQEAEEMLTKLNRVLSRQLPINIFMAAGFIEVSANQMSARVLNAGLPDLLWLRNGSLRQRLPSTTMPLGIIENVDISEGVQTLRLQTDDVLYAFSDGIIETTNINEDMFDYERLIPLLEKLSRDQAPLENIILTLEEYAVGGSIKDDITLVEVPIGTYGNGTL